MDLSPGFLVTVYCISPGWTTLQNSCRENVSVLEPAFRLHTETEPREVSSYQQIRNPEYPIPPLPHPNFFNNKNSKKTKPRLIIELERVRCCCVPGCLHTDSREDSFVLQFAPAGVTLHICAFKITNLEVLFCFHTVK